MVDHFMLSSASGPGTGDPSFVLDPPVIQYRTRYIFLVPRRDARHVLTFLDEHPKRARHGFVVCRCSRAERIDDRVTALPWWEI